MAQELRRRQTEEASGRNALVPSDAASMATMIGAMLIGLSATDVAYRDAAARGVDRPAFDPGPDAPDEPGRDGGADALGSMPFHHADDPADPQAAPDPAMEVLPPPPHWDPWTRFDPIDAQGGAMVDVTEEPPAAVTAGAAASAGGSSGTEAAASTSAYSAAEGVMAAAAADVAGVETIIASTTGTARDMIGDTMAVLDAAVEHVASSVHDIVQPLTEAVETTVGQIGGAIDDVGAAIGETVDVAGDAIGGVTQLAAGLPEAVLGGPEAPAIPDPVFTEAFKPDLPDAGTVQDIVGGVTEAVGSVTEPLHLGFLGQSTMDGMDAHDGAFSIFGSHI